jgi:hypothetical protein
VLKKDEEAQLCQGRFDFLNAPQPVLCAVQVSPNDLARERRFTIHPNRCVPEHSVSSRVFYASNPVLISPMLEPILIIQYRKLEAHTDRSAMRRFLLAIEERTMVKPQRGCDERRETLRMAR